MNRRNERQGETKCLVRRLCAGLLVAGCLAKGALAQTPVTWQQVKDRFEAVNPSLRAAQLNIEESKAQQITAYLRPNPNFTLLTDGTQIAPFKGVWRPFTGTMETTSFSYLHERRHKRELRLDSAKKSTDIAASTYSDQARTLLFSLRTAFVQTLQAKAALENARENLDYWDRELDLNRIRFKAGDIARIDLDRLELQRVQFESDYEAAVVNLRTAKIQLLTLLNDRTPIEQFDVTGPFDFADQLMPLEEFRVEGHLLVVLLVHEDVVIAVLVEVLHLARIDERALDLVLGAKPLIGLGADLDVLHLDLHEGAAATADVNVIALDHAPDALVPLEQVADPDSDCLDLRHESLLLP